VVEASEGELIDPDAVFLLDEHPMDLELRTILVTEPVDKRLAKHIAIERCRLDAMIHDVAIIGGTGPRDVSHEPIPMLVQSNHEADRHLHRRLGARVDAGADTGQACLLVLAVIATARALVLRNRALDSESEAADARDEALVNEAEAEAEAAREDAEIERLVALSASEIAVSPDRAILLALQQWSGGRCG
jgi:hypothetical protein